MTRAGRYRGRFAPSPTGPLHLGSLLSAWASWLDARQQGGEWLVRIEDIDAVRERPGVAAQQLRDLAAFGLQSDRPVVYQQQRLALYQAALDRLLSDGHGFACSCTRADLLPFAGLHRRCLRPVSAQHQAIRFRPPTGVIQVRDRRRGEWQESPAETLGDFVVQRADGLFAYQLAVVVDDAEQGITDIVRGADLLDSTARQISLQQALSLPTPNYLHLPLLVGDDGRKLSKSWAAAPIDPNDPIPTLRRLWRQLGQDPQALAATHSLDQLQQRAIENFEPQKIPLGPLPARLEN